MSYREWRAARRARAAEAKTAMMAARLAKAEAHRQAHKLIVLANYRRRLALEDEIRRDSAALPALQRSRKGGAATAARLPST